MNYRELNFSKRKAIHKFSNGYTIVVIQLKRPYMTNNGRYELSIIKPDGKLYEMPIVWLTGDMVTSILNQVSKLTH